MDKRQLLEILERRGVTPVVSVNNLNGGRGLARALISAGLPLVEVTFRTAGAADVISDLRNRFPELVVGAGTLLTERDVSAAVAAGAHFGVAPGLDEAVVVRAGEHSLPFFPGVMTPSEIGEAVRLGCDVLKYFPACSAGGPDGLRSASAPFTHLGIRFVATGGIGPNAIGDWLSVPGLIGVGGSWIASSKDIVDRRWERIRDRAADVVDSVQRFRATPKAASG